MLRVVHVLAGRMCSLPDHIAVSRAGGEKAESDQDLREYAPEWNVSDPDSTTHYSLHEPRRILPTVLMQRMRLRAVIVD